MSKEISLNDICVDLVKMIGPDMDAIIRFRNKEGQKCEPIIIRLNELLALMEEVITTDQFGDPKAAANKLNEVFKSIDETLMLVQNIKERLQLLDKDVKNRKPNPVFGFLKKKFLPDQSKAVNLEEEVKFNTDELIEECIKNSKN